jgi:hypothetical protein
VPLLPQKPLLDKLPNLKVVMEHITTADAAEFVAAAPANIAATITPQHMLLNRNALFAVSAFSLVVSGLVACVGLMTNTYVFQKKNVCFSQMRSPSLLICPVMQGKWVLATAPQLSV